MCVLKSCLIAVVCSNAFVHLTSPRIIDSLTAFEASVEVSMESDESPIVFREDSIAVLLMEKNATQFTNQTFIAMVEEDLSKVVDLQLKEDFGSADSNGFVFSVNIPETLPEEVAGLTDPVRVSYNIFTTSRFFQNDPDSKFGQNISNGTLNVGDIVISASLPNSGKVEGLVHSRVTITFTKPEVR